MVLQYILGSPDRIVTGFCSKVANGLKPLSIFVAPFAHRTSYLGLCIQPTYTAYLRWESMAGYALGHSSIMLFVLDLVAHLFGS